MPSPLSRFQCLPAVPITAVVLLAAALSVQAPVLGEWADELESEPFLLRSESRLGDRGARELLDMVIQQQQEVCQALNLQPGNGPIEIYLFQSQRSYRRYLAVRVPDGASRPALFVKGPDASRVYLYEHRGYGTDLRHESTHAVLHNALPYLPLWLDEGLAEYFEVPAAARSSGNPHLGSVRRAMLFGWSPRLRDLESRQDLSDMDRHDYRDSWCWVHFLLHGPLEVRLVLADYLYDVESGNIAGSLGDRLERIPGIEQHLIHHLKTWN